MSWKQIYHSSFGQRHPHRSGGYAGITINIYIDRWYDDDTNPTSEQIDLVDESPLLIEWDARAKEEPICGSTATLKVISTTDRKFVPLMLSEPGSIRLRVSDQHSQIWRGYLDMRQCEEPYYTREGYETELVFTDLGLLDRIKFNGTGIKDGETLVNEIYSSLTRMTSLCSFNTSTVPEGVNPTNVDAEDRFALFSFDCANFYDEDGEPETMMEVLTDILTPFNCQIRQFTGSMTVYDLAALRGNGFGSEVEWMSTDQVLSFDKFVNVIRITFSTYCNASLLEGELDTQGQSPLDYDDDLVNLFDNDMSVDFPYFSKFPDVSDVNLIAGRSNVSHTFCMLKYFNPWVQYDNPFTFPGVAEYDWEKVVPFHVIPYGGGEECDGFASRFTGNSYKWENGQRVRFTPAKFEASGGAHQDDGTTLFKMDDVYVPPLQGWVANKFLLRLSMEMMVDPRLNPFEQSGDYNNKDQYEFCNKHHNHTFVKLLIQLKDAQGNVLAHYSNAPFLYKMRNLQPHTYYDMHKRPDVEWLDDQIRTSPTVRAAFNNRYVTDLRSSMGGWYDAEEWAVMCELYGEMSPYCYIDYYSANNIDESCGCLGFQKNRHNVGSMAKLSGAISSLEDGQYLPYPYQGGYIHIEVMKGYFQTPNKYPWYPGETIRPWHDVAQQVYYKLPQLEIVRNTIKKQPAEFDDIQVVGNVNDYGVDDLTIDTKCGSSIVDMPSSKGCVLVTSTKRQLKRATRSGHTDTLENLLLGSLYSQYHGHKKVLSGTIRFKPDATILADGATDGVFMRTAEVYDVKDGTSQITMTELSPESFIREGSDDE